MINPMASAHFLRFLLHEDEAQELGVLYIPQSDGTVNVKKVYGCEEYEEGRPAKNMPKKAARAHYQKNLAKKMYGDEQAYEAVSDYCTEGRLPLFYYPEMQGAYRAAAAGCTSPRQQPWKDAAGILSRWGRGRNYAQTLTNLLALRA
tara:strand:- start:1143 stop:1583 length:441 start_codon:yes stop_codon:yes gene_type:complete